MKQLSALLPNNFTGWEAGFNRWSTRFCYIPLTWYDKYLRDFKAFVPAPITEPKQMLHEVLLFVTPCKSWALDRCAGADPCACTESSQLQILPPVISLSSWVFFGQYMPKQLKKSIWFPTREVPCGKLVFSCVPNKYNNSFYTFVWESAWHLCQHSSGNKTISLHTNSNHLKPSKSYSFKINPKWKYTKNNQQVNENYFSREVRKKYWTSSQSSARIQICTPFVGTVCAQDFIPANPDRGSQNLEFKQL